MFIVGIDVAKRSHEATIITSEDGAVVQSAFSFRNNCSGYNVLLERVRKLTNQRGQIVFAMESTAHYWLALYARLTKDGYVLALKDNHPVFHDEVRTYFATALKEPRNYPAVKSLKTTDSGHGHIESRTYY